MFTLDAALQHTCASFREQARLGRITPAECDLLVDGAIVLALRLEALAQGAQAGDPVIHPAAGPAGDWYRSRPRRGPGRHEPVPAGRHAA